MSVRGLNAGPCDELQNDAGTEVSYRHNSGTLVSRNVPVSPRPNPGKHFKSAHKAMARMLGYSLTLGTAEDWAGFCELAAHRLTPSERAGLAWAALRSLPEDDAADVVELVFDPTGSPTGSPIAPLFDPMDEAAFWADMAGAEELEAYCLACFNRMPASRQAAFIAHASRKVAA